jgi:mono/diheme cytochrome c family protein
MEQTTRLLAGMEEGLRGRKLARIPTPMAGPLARLWAEAQPAPGVLLIRLAARMGSAEAVAAAADLARNPRGAGADRAAMIELLGQLSRPEDLPVIVDILRRDASPTIQLAAVGALGAFAQPTDAGPLLDRYPSASPTVRARILGLLGSRREWAAALLDAIEHRRIAAKDLTPAQVQLIAQLSDPALLARLEAAWGKVPRVGSPEKKKRIAEIRGLLPEGDKGNAARGKPIFKENCAVCHKLFGEGESIGPELTGAERGDLDFLMTSLVDPSSLVRKEYQSQTIAMRDGRVRPAWSLMKMIGS